MNAAGPVWGYALEHEPPIMLQLVLDLFQRDRAPLVQLTRCSGDNCAWFRSVANCLQDGPCCGVVVFCTDNSAACCITNKVSGIRAAVAHSVKETEDALKNLGANLLIVNPDDKTFFEFKRILELCVSSNGLCPGRVATVLKALEPVVS